MKFNRNYYQKRHDTEKGYQNNNWSLQYVDLINSLKRESIVEIGCGNGKFIEEMIKTHKTVYGIDWAKASSIEKIESKFNFIQEDINIAQNIQCDIAVSADVLEHVPMRKIKDLIKTIDQYAPIQLHKIACYRAPSHLTVIKPIEWLKLFKEVDKNYYIYDVHRRSKKRTTVTVIGKRIFTGRGVFNERE